MPTDRAPDAASGDSLDDRLDRALEDVEAGRIESAAPTHERSTMKCATCESPSPNRHPSVQFEGETEPCPDHFHDADTRQSEWLRSYIAEKRVRLGIA